MTLLSSPFYRRGSETLLGETSDVSELFLSDDCEDKHLFTVAEKCTVSYCTEQ